jgi:hypothetical protein
MTLINKNIKAFVNPSLAIVRNNFLLNVAFSIMIIVFILHLIVGIFW